MILHESNMTRVTLYSNNSHSVNTATQATQKKERRDLLRWSEGKCHMEVEGYPV